MRCCCSGCGTCKHNGRGGGWARAVGSGNASALRSRGEQRVPPPPPPPLRAHLHAARAANGGVRHVAVPCEGGGSTRQSTVVRTGRVAGRCRWRGRALHRHAGLRRPKETRATQGNDLPPISLLVSTISTRLCSSSVGLMAGGRGWGPGVRLALPGPSSARPSCALRDRRPPHGSISLTTARPSSCQTPHAAAAAAPASTRAISRITVVLPTPGRPRNSSELGTAGRGRAGWEVRRGGCEHSAVAERALLRCRHGRAARRRPAARPRSQPPGCRRLRACQQEATRATVGLAQHQRPRPQSSQHSAHPPECPESCQCGR